MQPEMNEPETNRPIPGQPDFEPAEPKPPVPPAAESGAPEHKPLVPAQSEIEEPGPNRSVLRGIFIVLAGLWLLLCVSATSVGAGYLLGQSTGETTRPGLGAFYQAWDIIHSRFVHQPVDDIKLVQGAIDGMMKSLGEENSTYMDPATYRAANDSLSGYEGIGASVDITGPYLKIIAPFAGSPAEKAGLKSGDEIIKIDGVDMTGKSLDEVRSLLLGPAGTHVKLSVRRPGEAELLEIDVIRAKIELPVVESRMLENNIAYLRLAIFSESADAQVQQALGELMKNDPKGLILDLRGNPGGLVTAAVDVASQFLPENTLLFVEKGGSAPDKSYFTHAGGLALNVPLIVLVDGGSASASEIVSGAIQDHGRGKLVGTVTYGKGSVQEWIALQDDMGAVRITVSYWYTPDGRQISGQGLTPDVLVTVSEEEHQAGKDPQLDRAVELLS
jgi:carboxyl-terminal processing protease